MCKNIQPFVIKYSDSINDQTNDNGPNSNLKYIYNVEKSAWMLKYGGGTFSLQHMNYVLVKAWYASLFLSILLYFMFPKLTHNWVAEL